MNDAFNETHHFKGAQMQENLWVLNSCIQKQLCMGGKMYSTFMDFKQNVNYVNHNVLFSKLLTNGMSGNFHNLIKNMKLF